MPTKADATNHATKKVASFKMKPLHATQLDEALHKLKTDGPVAAFPKATFDCESATDPNLPKPAQKPKRGNDPNRQPLHAVHIPGALIKLKTAGSIADLSEATLYRKAKSDPSFPRLIKFGTRCTRVEAGPFMAWLAAQGTDPVEVA